MGRNGLYLSSANGTVNIFFLFSCCEVGAVVREDFPHCWLREGSRADGDVSSEFFQPLTQVPLLPCQLMMAELMVVLPLF